MLAVKKELLHGEVYTLLRWGLCHCWVLLPVDWYSALKAANFVPPASSNSLNGCSYKGRLDKEYVQLLTLPYMYHMRYAAVKLGII